MRRQQLEFRSVRHRAFYLVEDVGGMAVLRRHDHRADPGPPVQVGDILGGAVSARGTCLLAHPAGTCAAVGDSGPLSREEALAWAARSAKSCRCSQEVR